MPIFTLSSLDPGGFDAEALKSFNRDHDSWTWWAVILMPLRDHQQDSWFFTFSASREGLLINGL